MDSRELKDLLASEPVTDGANTANAASPELQAVDGAVDVSGEHSGVGGAAAPSLEYGEAEALKQNTALLLCAAVLGAGGALDIKAVDIIDVAAHEFALEPNPSKAGLTIRSKPKVVAAEAFARELIESRSVATDAAAAARAMAAADVRGDGATKHDAAGYDDAMARSGGEPD